MAFFRRSDIPDSILVPMLMPVMAGDNIIVSFKYVDLFLQFIMIGPIVVAWQQSNVFSTGISHIIQEIRAPSRSAIYIYYVFSTVLKYTDFAWIFFGIFQTNFSRSISRTVFT
ncbi:hypothetical protein DSCW_11640 [Desulfosarcina widdelii]|uniref:Uncharacterized protein n=1 Tax=Desulfosarcina widdelii TaxID=947919 RepID=A0A5K7ZBM5_9BACT|nr:hypothetical protein DSCW_11640 [Desulfosarcina widdelii]